MRTSLTPKQKQQLIILESQLENDIDFAIKILRYNRQALFRNTRYYLEITSLLAIGYLRKLEIAKAKPFINEVLTNEPAIPTAGRRSLWRQQMLNRFKEEVTLTTLRSNDKPVLDKARIEKEVDRLMQYNSAKEIYEEIGMATPNITREMLLLLNRHSSKLSASQKRLAVSKRVLKKKNIEVGVTVSASIKKVLYKSLCSAESEIYKAWFHNGMKSLLSKEYIGITVTSCLLNFGIGMPLLIASVIALIIKFGIEVYCEKYKPIS